MELYALEHLAVDGRTARHEVPRAQEPVSSVEVDTPFYRRSPA
jgi:hypothetical protein